MRYGGAQSVSQRDGLQRGEQAGGDQLGDSLEQHHRQPRRNALLHVSDDDVLGAGHTVHVRPGRRRHADRRDRADRSGDAGQADGDEGAPERVAAQCLHRVGDGGPRLHGSHSIDAGQRDGAVTLTVGPTAMQTQSERGIALVLALFLMAAMSVLGASLMFLSQTETYASMNYRMMSQARYAGEAGIQRAANFLLAQYVPPSDTGTDVLTSYNYSVSPVTYNNLPVVLSAKDATCTGSNYPVAASQTAFCNAAKGTLTAGNASILYNATATLIAMQSFVSYSSVPVVVQTWQITGDGSLSGSRTATVEVAATIETPKMPAYGYAAFATNPGCGALQFQGTAGT
ncbi:MAG: hypothetical protein DMF94_06675, partial [Acidobacteria bacterium]